MKHRLIGLNRVGVLNSDGHTIGLDIGATAVRATILAPGTIDGRQSVTAHGTGEVPLAPGVVVNGVVREPAALTAALKHLWSQQKFECRHVILGIANQQVLVRDLVIPDLTPEQRAQALPFQAKEIVALPIDQVVLDFCQLSEPDPATNMVRGLLLATPRAPVLAAVTAVERANLKVARVDLSAFGALRSIADEQPGVEAIIDLGAHLTTIVIHDHGVPRLVRTLARGGAELTMQLADRMSTSEQDAEAYKRNVGLDSSGGESGRMLADALRPLIAEIRTSVQYFRSTNDGAAIRALSLTGGGAALRGIDVALTEQIGVPTRIVDATQHIRNRRTSQEVPTGYSTPGISAVAVGLAMGAAA